MLFHFDVWTKMSRKVFRCDNSHTILQLVLQRSSPTYTGFLLITILSLSPCACLCTISDLEMKSRKVRTTWVSNNTAILRNLLHLLQLMTNGGSFSTEMSQIFSRNRIAYFENRTHFQQASKSVQIFDLICLFANILHTPFKILSADILNW